MTIPDPSSNPTHTVSDPTGPHRRIAFSLILLYPALKQCVARSSLTNSPPRYAVHHSILSDVREARARLRPGHAFEDIFQQVSGTILTVPRAGRRRTENALRLSRTQASSSPARGGCSDKRGARGAHASLNVDASASASINI